MAFMINLRAVQILVAVIDSGSITRAAATLGITQPAVSMALRDLEISLGTPLLDRGARPLRPTHAGHALYQRGASLMADVASLRAVVASAAADRVALLRIGCVIPFDSSFVLRLQQMATEIEIRSGLTPDLLDALYARDLDIVVTSNPAVDRVRHLQRIRVMSEPFLAVLPPSLPDVHDWDAAKRRLASLPFVRYTRRSAIGGAIEGILRQLDLSPPEQFEFHTSPTVLMTVQAGLGWAITTPICIAQSRHSPASVRILPLPGNPTHRHLTLVHRHGEFEGTVERIRALVVEHLGDLVETTFAPMPWVIDSVRAGKAEGQALRT